MLRSTPQASGCVMKALTRLNKRRRVVICESSDASETKKDVVGVGGGVCAVDDEAVGSDISIDLRDSDFDSSDLEAALMSVGQADSSEASKLQHKWAKRFANKRNSQGRSSTTLRSRGVEEHNSSSSSGENAATVGKHTHAFGTCRAEGDVRALLALGQKQYADGKFDMAVSTLSVAAKKQPGLPDPYHILTVIHSERGDYERALDAMTVAAYFSPIALARPIWKRVAQLSQKQGRKEQALYAYKRSLAGKRTELGPEDHESLWELSQLYFERGNSVEGVRVLRALHASTRSSDVACEIGRCLVRLHRWREALDFLEGCVERDRSCKPTRINLNLVSVLATAYLEVRDFRKCANLIIDLLSLRSDKLQSSELREKVGGYPLELISKLGAALCRLRTQRLDDLDRRILQTTFDVIFASPAAEHPELQLLLLDSLLAESIEALGEGEGRQTAFPRQCAWVAENSARLLERLEGLDFGEDLRERRAMALWTAGCVRAAAELLEVILEEQSGRSEGQLRDLRVRVVNAWIQYGSRSDADRCMTSLSYDDLQRSNLIPPAMSPEQRSQAYRGLEEYLEKSLQQVTLVPAEFDSFMQTFYKLIFDCELDYTRLLNHSSTRDRQITEEVGPLLDVPTSKAGEDDMQRGRSRRVKRFGTVAPVEQAQLAHSIIEFSGPMVKQKGLSIMDIGSVFLKRKRKHLGLESVEDNYGLEAYIDLVVRGCDLLRRFGRERGFTQASPAASWAHQRQITRCVELCEAILANRRLVALRNPVKRRMFRTLAMKSVSMAYESRLWRVVFKHLRAIYDHGEDADSLMSLLARVFFTHEEATLVSGKNGSDGVQWEKFRAHSQSGHRHTYAASVSDVRAWALRKLMLKPNSFALLLLSAHFCMLSGKYSMAIAEYARAHRAAPSHPLAALCLAVGYLSFSMSRMAARRHELIIKGFAFVQMYRRLRVAEAIAGLTQTSAEASIEVEAEHETGIGITAARAEVLYNIGRAFHQLNIKHLAVRSYSEALSEIESLESCRGAKAKALLRRTDVVVVRRSCAHNLALLYRSQGSNAMARATLWRHVNF